MVLTATNDIVFLGQIKGSVKHYNLIIWHYIFYA